MIFFKQCDMQKYYFQRFRCVFCMKEAWLCAHFVDFRHSRGQRELKEGDAFTVSPSHNVHVLQLTGLRGNLNGWGQLIKMVENVI